VAWGAEVGLGEHAAPFRNDSIGVVVPGLSLFEQQGAHHHVGMAGLQRQGAHHHIFRRAIGRGGLWLPLPGGRVGALEDSGRTG
jgi:hypothetical protein